MALGFLDSGGGNKPPTQSSGTLALTPHARAQVGELLAQHGRLAGSYACLGEDPWQFNWCYDDAGILAGFTPYLRTKRAAVVWRGPVGPQALQPEALAQFDEHLEPNVDRYILGADESIAAAAADLGYQKVWIGTDCVTSLTNWSLAGGRRRKLRWARNHVAATHEWFEVFPATDEDTRNQMLAVEAEWKQARKARATDSFLRTALMEQADIRRHFACRNLTTGKINSYLTCLPINADSWYLQDCVRTTTAERGTLEGAVALACETFSNEGFGTASNGILPMFDPGDGTHVPDTSRLQRTVIRLADNRYRFAGLHQFRMKLVPDEAFPVYALLKPGRPTPRGLAGFVKITTKRLF